MKTTFLAAVLALASGCASAGAPADGSLVIKLVKPDLVYVGEQAVAQDQLRKKLQGREHVLVILDPEMKLSTLSALEKALAEVPPKELEIKGAGRWILEAIVEQRSAKAAAR